MLTNESRRGWLIVEWNSKESRDLCGRWREERVCNNAHCIELQWINNNHIFDLFSASIIFAYTLRPSWNCNWIEILSPFSLSAASQATGWNATAPGRCIWAGISHRTNTHGIHSSSSCKFSRESKAFESCWNVLNEILQPIRRHFCARLMYFMFKLSSALISNLFFFAFFFFFLQLIHSSCAMALDDVTQVTTSLIPIQTHFPFSFPAHFSLSCWLGCQPVVCTSTLCSVAN